MTTMSTWHSMLDPFGKIPPKQRNNLNKETSQVAKRVMVVQE